MALIKCPECGRENVSSSAKKCPGCGINIADFLKSEEQEYQDILEDTCVSELLNENKKMEVVEDIVENEIFVDENISLNKDLDSDSKSLEENEAENDKTITEITSQDISSNGEKSEYSFGLESQTGEKDSKNKKPKKKIKLAYVTLILGILSIPLLCAWGLGGCLAVPVIIISIVLLVSKTEEKVPTIIGMVCSFITLLIIVLILVFAIGETSKDAKTRNQIQSYINSGEYDLAYDAVVSSNLSDSTKDDYKYTIYLAKGEYDNAAYLWLNKLQGKADKTSITTDEMNKISSIYDNLSDNYKEQYDLLVQERDAAIVQKQEEERIAAEEKAKQEAEEKAKKEAEEKKKREEEEQAKEEKEVEKQAQTTEKTQQTDNITDNSTNNQITKEKNKYILTEEDKKETEWYVPPTELGDGSEYRSIEIDSVVYRFPCPITEFLKNGFSLMDPTDAKFKGGSGFSNGFYMDAKGKDHSGIDSIDEIIRYDSDGYVALVKDDIIINVYYENVDKSKNIPLKYCQVPRIASINQLYDANVEPIHVLFPAKYGAKDPFYMTEEEMVKLQDSEYCYPVYKNIKPGPVDLELYQLNSLKWIDGDRFFKMATGGINVRTIFLGP